MTHPSERPDRDPVGDAAVARVNAIRAARGLPPIVERDPAIVRRGLVGDRDSLMVAVAVLHRPGCGATVPDAIDEVLAGKPVAAAFDVPPGVALAILRRTSDNHAPEVFAALDTELTRFAAKCAGQPSSIRELSHLAVHRLHLATRTAIADRIADELPAPGTVVAGTAITDDMRTQAADYAADVAIAATLDRLRDDLLTVGALP